MGPQGSSEKTLQPGSETSGVAKSGYSQGFVVEKRPTSGNCQPTQKSKGNCALKGPRRKSDQVKAIKSKSPVQDAVLHVKQQSTDLTGLGPGNVSKLYDLERLKVILDLSETE